MMRIFKIVAVIVAYLIIGVLEIYSYYLFRNDDIIAFVFLTLLGFIATFGIVITKDME